MEQDVFTLLSERGLVEQVSDPSLKDFVSRPRNVYIGFDPTADSLHLGHLIAIVALEWFRRCGHTPYVILGGATGRIGDPSGKSMERPQLEDEIIEKNVSALACFFQKIFPHSTCVILNNDDWYRSMSVVDFLRDIGKMFRVGQMMAKESVRIRLNSEEGISFTEFSYQVLQGYDFAYLAQKHQVTIQMGGADQWGNITAGIECNRKIGGEPVYGLTFPLLIKSDGKKFGKSEGGAVWLSPDKLSPYQFYQFLMNTADADVIKLLKMLTFLDLQEIATLERAMNSPSYIPNSLQQRLAEEVTRFVHGQEGLSAAQRVTAGMSPGTRTVLSAASFDLLIQDTPHSELPQNEVIDRKLTDLVVTIGFVPSKSEAVRLIKSGGLYLNNERVQEGSYVITKRDLVEGSYLLLSVGKKRKFLLRVSKIDFEK